MKQQRCIRAAILVSALVLIAALLLTQRTGAQSDYAWEMLCSGVVKPVQKKLKLPQSGDVASAEDLIQLCTKHVYSFNGKAGQRLDVRLTGSDGVSMFLLWKNQRSAEHPALFYLEREWQGKLPAAGKYTLTVVTERNAASYQVEFKVY
jgi:hypothetical protein